MRIETTERGFALIGFTDYNGVACSLQQSSAIDLTADGGLERPGSSLIWLGCDEANPKEFVPNGDPPWQPVPMPETYVANTRMHLNREQVISLVTNLQAWLETGLFAG